MIIHGEQNKELKEASTRKSAKTHAGTFLWLTLTFDLLTPK